ncbi:MAG TPA: hypothetical protein VH165_34425 [Kofleriaceae bacterium]|nr:hypothetical protein [Kofleriaceae bacterium]
MRTELGHFTAQVFGEVGELLHVTGHIIGSDRVEGRSVLRFDGIPQDDDGELPQDGDLQLLGLAEAMSCSMAKKPNSAIDLEAWVDGLDGDDRRMLASRATGYTLEETATKVGCCLSTVFARTRQLGEELAHRIGVELQRRGACAV